MKVAGIGAVGWLVVFVVSTSSMVNGRHTKMETLLIDHIIYMQYIL